MAYSFDVFFDVCLNKWLNKPWNHAITAMWRQYNGDLWPYSQSSVAVFVYTHTFGQVVNRTFNCLSIWDKEEIAVIPKITCFFCPNCSSETLLNGCIFSWRRHASMFVFQRMCIPPSQFLSQCWVIVNWTLVKHLREFYKIIQILQFNKMCLKLSSAKCRPLYIRAYTAICVNTLRFK